MPQPTPQKPLDSSEVLADIERMLPDCMLADRMALARHVKRGSRRRGKDFKQLKRLRDQAYRSRALLKRRKGSPLTVSYPESLPLSERRTEILKAIKEHPVVIVAGETGSGKTTQLPKICLEAGRGVEATIACTQPRRVAALSVSKRIAEELGVQWGQQVGCKIRFSDDTVPDTRIKMMTDGMLLAEVQRDPDLYEYDTIIIDEAHERSLNIDFLLGYLRLLRERRPELKIVITSATIDVGTFSRAFDDAPIIEVSGRVYPVAIRYEPLLEQHSGSEDYTYIDASVDAVDMVVDESSRGDMLVFMPTEKDIHEMRRRLEGRSLPRTDVLPLFGRLTASDQQRVFAPQKGRRRIVVATNIAETSLTIPRIRYVIDPGMARVSRYNARNQTHRLPVEPIAQSSARQRAGRCGRLSDGICVRLYSESDLQSRPEFTQPEIQRSNLAEVILRMLSLRLGDVRTFPFIDPPRPQAVSGGFQLLSELGAIDGDRRLTDLGRDMSRLPIDPTVSRMVLQAREEGALHDVLIISSAISIQDPRVRPLEQQKEADAKHRKFLHRESDFVTLLNIWNAYHDQLEHMDRQSVARKFCKRHFISFNRMREWRDIYTQLRRILRELGFQWRSETASYDAVHRSIICGLMSNVAQKKEDNLYRAARSRDVMIFPGSGLFQRKVDSKDAHPSNQKTQRTPSWIIAAEMVETSRLFARTVARIQPGWITELGGHLCKASYSEPTWDDGGGRVMVPESLSLFGLQVQRKSVPYHAVNPEESREIFIQEALVEGKLEDVPDFVAHNQTVVQEINSWQLARRGGDMDLETAVSRFYHERVPEVSAIKDLRQFVLEEKNGDATFLQMTVEELTGGRNLEMDPNDFPSHLYTEGESLPVSYAYQPGMPEDGVTVALSAEIVRAVSPEALEWLVPGMLREKVESMLRGLPKSIRRKFVPIPNTAEQLTKLLRPSDQSLAGALGALIAQEYRIQIDRSDWRVDQLPEYLVMRVRVMSDDGGVLYEGRDLREMLGTATEGTTPKPSDAWTRAADEWDQFDLREWTIGDVPEQVLVSGPGEVPIYGFPGLYVDDGLVCLRLFRERAEAERESRSGLIGLYEITLHQELAWVREALESVWGFASLCQLAGGKERLSDGAFEYLVDLVLLDGTVFPLTQARYDEAMVAARELLPPVVPRFIEKLGALERAYSAAVSKTGGYAEAESDIERLMPRDFLRGTPFARLDDDCRYLKAVEIRADRARIDRLKDGRKADLVRPYQARLDRFSDDSYDLDFGVQPLIDEYRWMVEEFRVSTFAQELRTPIPISEKRLDKKLAEIDQALKYGVTVT